MERLFFEKALKIMRSSNGFSFKAVSKRTGQIITMNNVVITTNGFHYRNATITVKSLISNEIRTIYKILIIELNGKEISY